jgi:carboxypeptidase PM20D1
MMKRAVALLSLLVVAVVLVAVVRALLLRPPVVVVPAFTPLAVDAGGAVKRFASAVQAPTESHADVTIDAAAMARFRDLLQQSFPKVHAAMQREVMPSGAMILTWNGQHPELPPVILMGHMDVVPPDPATLGEWKHAPYSGEIAEGAVWGRGTLDDKVSVMSLLEAAETLLGQGFTPSRTVLFCFGDDEENGGEQGAKKIVELLASRGVKAEFVVDEGGAVLRDVLAGMTHRVALVGLAEKGFVDVSLDTTAAGGHSSEPPAHTAIGKLSAGIARLEAHPFPAALTEPAKDELMAVAPYLPFSKRLVLANLWLTKPLVLAASLKEEKQAGGYHTTTAVTMIRGGFKDNALPTSAHALVNLRVLPGETAQTVLEGVRQRVGDAEVRASLGGVAHDPSPISPASGEPFRILGDAIHQMYGSDTVVTPYLVQGGTDGSYYYRLSPAVYRFAPIEGDLSVLTMIHGVNEHMGVDNYLRAVQFQAQLLRNLR